MDENRYIERVQWLVLTGLALLLVLLTGAWVTESGRKEWRSHQKAHGRILDELALADGSRGGAPPERGIFQLELPHLGRVDRCISCHVALEDPRMAQAPQPLRSHPGSYLAGHPPQEYGCTVCHGGQGRALASGDAHGRDPAAHWPYPLLESPYIQSSCGKCHLAIFGDRMAGMTGPAGERTGTGSPERPGGMEVFEKGKAIFAAEGCLGCHKARGVGGIIGPDLTEQGEKTRHEYSFQNIRGEQTISNWLIEHFRDPEMVSPGSQMLRIELEEEDLESLATFVMGLARPEIPFEFFSMPTLMEFKGIREPIGGPAGFAYLCSACHGKKGGGKSYEEYETGIPAIGGRDFLRVASDDYIRFTLLKGRSRRQMASWAEEVSGVTEDELEHLAGFVGSRYPESAPSVLPGMQGDRGRGRVLFAQQCAACHGEDGRGGVAVALNQQGFLDRAGDDFILATLVSGRGNTAMPAWAHLPAVDLLSLVSFIRTWGGAADTGAGPGLPEGRPAEGALKFHYRCSRCHGESGQGETGPAIINRDFLKAAGDRFLYETIAFGRAHTAMFGWSADVYGQEQLDRQGIADIVAFMRLVASTPPEYIYAGSNPGHQERGAVLFAEKCAECHGREGEGVKGPALNNQEFLSGASNGFIQATITLGREGTAMPSWGYGGDSYSKLTGGERQDLVAHIRSWQRIHIRF